MVIGLLKSCETKVWRIRNHRDAYAVSIAEEHYSRRKRGANQFMPPGQRLILVRDNAVFGWWRPHPDSGLTARNNLDGWTCTIFRNIGNELSSTLILEAELKLAEFFYKCGPDGMLTYVWDSKVKSSNPGYCFKCAGWRVHPTRPRSADNKKTLLWKAFEHAGMKVCSL